MATTKEQLYKFINSIGRVHKQTGLKKGSTYSFLPATVLDTKKVDPDTVYLLVDPAKNIPLMVATYLGTFDVFGSLLKIPPEAKELSSHSLTSIFSGLHLIVTNNMDAFKKSLVKVDSEGDQVREVTRYFWDYTQRTTGTIPRKQLLPLVREYSKPYFLVMCLDVVEEACVFIAFACLLFLTYLYLAYA